MDPGALPSGRRESVHGVSKVFMGLRLRFTERCRLTHSFFAMILDPYTTWSGAG